jgi:hypothetical protein
VDKLWITFFAAFSRTYPQVINSGRSATRSYPQVVHRVMHIEICGEYTTLKKNPVDERVFGLVVRALIPALLSLILG